MNTTVSKRNHRLYITCTMLGLLASIISLALSIYMYWQLGSGWASFFLAGFGVVVVIAAHMLPALTRHASSNIRILAVPLWLCCMAFVCYSHVNYFLTSQLQVGQAREAAIPETTSVPQQIRSMAVIRNDIAKAKTELMRKSAQTCSSDCLPVRIRIASLKSKLDVLDAEEQEAAYQLAKRERTEALKSESLVEPVVFQLAGLTGWTTEMISLIASVLFSCILDGLGCFFWYLAWYFRDLSMPPQVLSQVAMTPAESIITADATLQSFVEDSQLLKVLEEVKAGRLKPTVENIRLYLGCAQKIALLLRREVATILDAEKAPSL